MTGRNSRAYHLRQLASRVGAAALVGGLLLGAGLSGLPGSGIAAAPVVRPSSADRPVVVLNSYAPRNQTDDAAPASPLADGSVFVAPGLPGSCSVDPCFDRAAVLNELVRVGGGQSDCYQLTHVERSGGHVTGRIEVRSESEAANACG